MINLIQHIGEGEKSVEAVLSLTQKFSTCVVFIHEADSLFGAHILSCQAGGTFAHGGAINEVISIMDGPCDLISNVYPHPP